MNQPNPFLNQTNTATSAHARSARAIRQEFHALERRVRTIICLTGISRISCLVFGGVILWGLLDWLIRFDDPGLRWLAALTLLAGTAWLIWRGLWKPMTEQRSQSFLAALIERRRPYTGNQLTSAAEFLEHNLDPRRGSPLLQQAVIQQAEHRLAAIDLETVLDRREVRRQTLLSAIVCGLALALLVLFPAAATTAVTRLMIPWSKTPWPRRVQLQFVQHDLTAWNLDATELLRVARGDTLELYARNVKGALPNDVTLEYRIGQDRVIHEPMRRTILRDEQGHPVDVVGINLPAARGPIFLRAVGGDDDLMAFQQIEVVSPPEITALEIQLRPPAYSGRPAESLPAGAGDIHALAGTQVTWTATASQPLNRAALAFHGAPAETLRLDDDGRSLFAELVLSEPKVTGYHFDLENRDGFHSGSRGQEYQLRITPDQVPQVTLEEPSANPTATVDAVLPLRIKLSDDLGLVSVQLVYQTDTSSEPGTQPLQQFADLPAQMLLTESFSLAPLNLSPGDRLQFHIEALDAYDLGPAHVGHSTTRIVTIIGEDQKRDELTDRLAELLADFSDGVSAQRRVELQTDELQTQLKNSTAVRPEDADLLRKLELEQQQVQHKLLEPGNSVGAQAERLLKEFAANHLTADETTDRLQSLSKKLSELGREELPDMQRRLTQAQKQAVEANEQTAEQLADELADLHTQQAAVVQELSALEAELSGWRDRRHIEQQLSGLIDAQRGLSRSTRELTEQLLKRTDGELSTQERTESAKLSQRQRLEADAVDHLRKQLSETSQALAKQDPASAQRLEELSNEMNDSGISDQLREAATSLAAERPGQALQLQEEGLRKLEELESRFENRPPADKDSLVKELKSLEDDLETLQKAETQLAGELQSTLNEPESPERDEKLQQLTKRQQELREELQELEQNLERLQLKGPREAVRRAGQQMEQSAQSSQAPAEIKEHLQEAADDLEQARRVLAQERERAEEELAFEQLLRLKDELQGLANRQTAVRDEVLRLEELRQARGAFTRGQLRTLMQTAETERDLSSTLNSFSEKLSSAEVVALTVRRIAERMTDVASRMEQKEIDSDTQERLQWIQNQLARLLAILSPENQPKDQPPGEQSPEQRAEASTAGPPGDVITLIAQLELLKDLQSDCAIRTVNLEQHRDPTGNVTPDQAEELAALQRDQQQLTDLARNLLGRLLEQQAAEPDGDVSVEEPKQPPAE